MKHYELMFLPNFRVSSPTHKRKDPYWRLSGNGNSIARSLVRTPTTYLAKNVWFSSNWLVSKQERGVVLL